MPNEYANKIIINGQTRIDLTGDTVTADKLMRGYTAHDRSGAPITGTHDDLTAEPLSVSANGIYTAPSGKAYTPVVVAVPSPETQTRTATPSLSTQSITPDSGKLLSAVTVDPITAQLLASLDADFAAGNIKKDVDLFGLIGTLEAESEVKVEYNSIYLESGVSSITVAHGLNKLPKSALLVSGANTAYSSVLAVALYHFNTTEYGYSQYIEVISQGSTGSSSRKCQYTLGRNGGESGLGTSVKSKLYTDRVEFGSYNETYYPSRYYYTVIIG